MSSSKNTLPRRGFIKASIVGTSALSLSAINYRRVYGSTQRLRIASIGTGGKGASDLAGVAASPAVDVAALCDIDHSANHLGQAANKYANAKQFYDWRQLLDQSKELDAVIVSTPDFMHAPISLAAMQLGKHVFCQKPLTHTVFEARQMQLAAARYGVTTQMGNQIQSHSAYRTAVKIVHDGMIGKVKEVHSWQGGQPQWPRHIERPVGSDPVPEKVRWDLWQGVAEERPYKTGFYHPFNWRGWQAYGTGQLGDFGCHILDPVFMALELTAPLSVQGDAPELKPESWPDRCSVLYQFPGTSRTAARSIVLNWYDAVGVALPKERLTGLPQDYKLPVVGSVLIGEKGTLVIPHVAAPQLFSTAGEVRTDFETVADVDHYVQFADACRGEVKATSHFAYAGPLTEAVLLGTIAIRFPGQLFNWDTQKLSLSGGATQASQWLSKAYRKGWEPTWIK